MYTEFQPKTNLKNATLIITHGLAEYSKSYLELAKFLQAEGYNVITYDIKGHGKRKGKRGYVDSYQEFLADLDSLVNYAFTRTEKVFLYGHSLGGVITNLYALENQNISGVVVTASPTNYLPIMRLLKVIPGFLINNLKLKTNFNDPRLNHQNKYLKDQYDLDYVVFKLVLEVMIKGMKQLRKSWENYSTPVLLIYSKKDKLASYKYGEKMIDKIASKDKTLLLYEKSFHNLHTDIEKEKLQNDLLNWLDKRA
jgi:alpha-beta hydrolase superfamily lysophospholipase